MECLGWFLDDAHHFASSDLARKGFWETSATEEQLH
jgi:hypothetical protein